MDKANEKAITLVEKFYFKFRQSGKDFQSALETRKHKKSLAFSHSVSAALIAVDEIIKVTQDTWSRIPNIGQYEDYIPYRFWQDVKTEIKNLT